jgi:cytosine/adenosine deaminase-related metal-dependent hydrolase
VTVAHNPVANMILASGICPLLSLRRAGITVGLGTDGAASNDSQNMLEAIKATALLQKVTRLDARAITGRAMLSPCPQPRAPGHWTWTARSALWSRASAPTSSGWRPTGLANIHDPYQQIAYCTSPADVADVWVDGHRRVADGRLVDHDLAAPGRREPDFGRRAGDPRRPWRPVAAGR